MRPDDLHPGDLIAGKYRVRAILARQPSMLVEAFHTEFDQRVIVKVLPAWAADSKEVERFRREARVLAKLESEHVARIVDVGSEKDGSFYLVRQHLEGTELGEHVQKVGALPLEEAVGIVMQLAEAVAETHVHGIVIRELSPAHVHLARRVGGGPIAKITDFGTAKLLRDNAAPAGNSSLTATAMFGLSPYSSPEMVRKAKNVDGRTDVWSLGAILYHLLTGQPPFQGDIATLMLAITRDDPTPPSMLRRGLPQELDQIVAWALAKDVDRRFRDVNALAHALVPYGTSESQVLAERITALHAAARGHKDGPGSRPASPRTQPPPRSAPPRAGGAAPPPPGSMRPPPVPTNLGGSNGPRTQPPPPMPPGGGGGVVAAMRSRLPSGLENLPAGEDDATVVLGANEQQTGRPHPGNKASTIPPPPPSMPPTPWQPGAERARSPRIVPPAAALSQPPPSMASQMGSVSSALGGQMTSSFGSSSLGGGTLQGSSHGPSSSQSLSRDAVAAQAASTLSPASSQALQRASKTQGGQDRRVLVGAMASMAVLLPVILVLLLSKSSTTTDTTAAPIPIATERALAATPDPVPPPTSAPIVATAENPSLPAPAPSGSEVVAVAAPPAPPPTTNNNAGTRTPPTRTPPTPPPTREPPPKKEPPKKEEPPPKKEEPKSSGGGSNGNLLAIASGGSCTFIVNGSPKGSGSSVKVALSPGNYSVTCKPSSGASKSRSVSIKAGETSMLTFKL